MNDQKPMPPAADAAPAAADDQSAMPEDVGGRKRLDPTRYGDWELNGKCVDF